MSKRRDYVQATNRPGRRKRPNLAVHLARPTAKLLGGPLDGCIAHLTTEQHDDGEWATKGGEYRRARRAKPGQPWEWVPNV